MFRLLLSTASLACAFALTGCGGEDSDGDGATSRGNQGLTAGDRRAVPQCEAAGINERVGRQGTCFIGDVKRTVANRRERLIVDDDVEIRLEDLAVRARGGARIVVASLAVRNLRRRLLRWPASARQIALWIDRRLISQGPHGRSLALRALRPAGKPTVTLAPGRTSSVAAGWRLSRSTAAGLRRRGSAIIVVPPGGGSEWVDAARRIGVLRLWK